jgi:hypothetical protein
MNAPDVHVTVEGGVADVQVSKPNVIVEVRDYDVDGVEDDHELLWTDENGDCCVRYLVTHDAETSPDQQEAVEQSNTP